MEQRYHENKTIPPIPLQEGFPQTDNPICAASVMAEAEPLDTTTATELTALLQQETRARRKETISSLAWSGAFLALTLCLARTMEPTAQLLKMRFILCIVLMGTVGWGMCIGLIRRSYRRKRSLTDALSKVDDKTQVGSLIRSLQVQNTPVRTLAQQRLIALLPALRASDASLLEESERKILIRQLMIFPNDPGYRDLKELFSRTAYRREMDLRLAILKALEQVGGEQELATVERLARGLPTVYSALKAPQEIREAAEACLPYLQERANDQRAGAQLLRASSLPVTAADTLLRPAALGTSTPPEQLLRASEPRS